MVVTRQLTSFGCDWFQLQVTDDRLVLQTSNPAHSRPLRDLAIGIFAILEHTPLRMMGLNRSLHYRMESEERWHAFGHYLAPKKAWQGLFESPPGLRSLTIEAKRSGCEALFVKVNVMPSVKIQPGVYFQTNEHYAFDASTENARRFVGIIKSSWDEAMAFASRVGVHMLSQDF